MTGGNPAENLKQLNALMAENDDPRDAFRAYTGDSLSAMARRIGMRRTDLNMMLEPGAVRFYMPERRLLESEYSLPAYSLDEVLGAGPITTTTTDGGKSGTEEDAS